MPRRAERGVARIPRVIDPWCRAARLLARLDARQVKSQVPDGIFIGNVCSEEGAAHHPCKKHNTDTLSSKFKEKSTATGIKQAFVPRHGAEAAPTLTLTPNLNPNPNPNPNPDPDPNPNPDPNQGLQERRAERAEERLPGRAPHALPR